MIKTSRSPSHHGAPNARNLSQIWGATADLFGHHRIDIAGGRSGRDAQLNHAHLPNGEVVYLDYGRPLRVDREASEATHFLVEIPLTGTSITYCGNDSVHSSPGQVVVVKPYQDFATEWAADCSKLLVKLEVEALEHYLSTLLGRRTIQALDFDLNEHIGNAASDTLLRTAQWILNEVKQPDSLIKTLPQAGLQYEQMLMWTLLHAANHNYSDALRSSEQPKTPPYIIQAEKFIKTNYHQCLDVAGLAALVKVSTRTLLEGFKRHRGISPMKLLKITRLDSVHLALKEADASHHNVTDIAFAHGFTQLSKFASDYKERFGVLPSMTLREPTLKSSPEGRPLSAARANL